MHKEALEWVAQFTTGDPLKVLDIGGRNINGTVRGLFPAADYTSIDLLPGVGVDVVADASTWVPDREYDLVVCCEVFEHTDVWPQICATAHKACRPGGRFIATMAGPGRAPHSAIDGGSQLHPSEHYGNIDPDELRNALESCGWSSVVIDQCGPDVRVHAVRP